LRGRSSDCAKASGGDRRAQHSEIHKSISNASRAARADRERDRRRPALADTRRLRPQIF